MSLLGAFPTIFCSNFILYKMIIEFFFREFSSSSTDFPSKISTDLSTTSYYNISADKVILISYIGVKDPVNGKVCFEIAFISTNCFFFIYSIISCL